MHIPTTHWEHPDTKATLVAMQEKIKAAQAETSRHNGNLAVFLGAMREAVRLGSECLASYPQVQGEGEGGDDDVGSEGSQGANAEAIQPTDTLADRQAEDAVAAGELGLLHGQQATAGALAMAEVRPSS